jgi:hypothetical protein
MYERKVVYVNSNVESLQDELDKYPEWDLRAVVLKHDHMYVCILQRRKSGIVSATRVKKCIK